VIHSRAIPNISDHKIHVIFNRFNIEEIGPQAGDDAIVQGYGGTKAHQFDCQAAPEEA